MALKKSNYNLSKLSKTTAKIGQIIPTLCEFLVPGDEFKVNPDLYIKLAPFAGPVSGSFQLRMKYSFVPIRLIWKEFNEWYLNKTGSSITHPYITNTDLISGGLGQGQYTSSYLQYYMPTGLALTNPADYDAQNLNVLPFRAYQKIWGDHYYKYNMALGTQIATPDYVTTSGQDTGVGTSTSQSIKYDYYDEDLYTKLKMDQQYGTAPTLGADPTWRDVKNLEALTNFQELIMHKIMDTKDYIANLFGVKPQESDRSELIKDFITYLELNEIVSTSSTTTAPLGASTTIAQTTRPPAPFSYTAKEFGYLMCTLSIVPESSIADGRDPLFMPKTSYMEYYNPAFVNLGFVTRPVAEMKCNGHNSNDAVSMGYAPIYDEYRYPRNWIAGEYTKTYHYMAVHRNPTYIGNTSTAPYNALVQSTEYDYLFAVPAEPHVRIFMRHGILANRPIPKILTENAITSDVL